MSKIENGRLDQYGAEPFKQLQFGTAGVEGVKVSAVPGAVLNVGLLQIHNQHIKFFHPYQLQAPKTARPGPAAPLAPR